MLRNVTISIFLWRNIVCRLGINYVMSPIFSETGVALQSNPIMQTTGYLLRRNSCGNSLKRGKVSRSVVLMLHFKMARPKTQARSLFAMHVPWWSMPHCDGRDSLKRICGLRPFHMLPTCITLHRSWMQEYRQSACWRKQCKIAIHCRIPTVGVALFMY